MVSGHCSIRLTRRYAATVGEVWAALTEPESVRRWFGPSYGQLPGRVRTSRRGRLLELLWDDEGETSIVRFELTEDELGTVLVLEHSRVDEHLGMAYMQRWTQAFERLDAELGR